MGRLSQLLLSRDDRVINPADVKATIKLMTNHHKFRACSSAMSFVRSSDARGLNVKRLAKQTLEIKTNSNV